jgi:hypothetical protein
MMAKITVTVCDLCANAGDDEVLASRHTIIIDGKAFELDLCDEHNGAVLAPLSEAIQIAGRKIRASKGPRLVRPAEQPKVVTPATNSLHIKCTEPGCTRTFETEEKRNRHIGQGHRRKERAAELAVPFSA